MVAIPIFFESAGKRPGTLCKTTAGGAHTCECPCVSGQETVDPSAPPNQKRVPWPKGVNSEQGTP